MANSEAFTQAVEKLKTLTKRPSNTEFLTLYGLFKQATEGDVTGSRPGGFDFKGAAKYDGWAEHKGKTTEEAEAAYVAHVDALHEKYQ